MLRGSLPSAAPLTWDVGQNRANPIVSCEPSDFASTDRRLAEVDERVATGCPCCVTADVDVGRSRVFSEAGASVNQHQSVLLEIIRTPKKNS